MEPAIGELPKPSSSNETGFAAAKDQLSAKASTNLQSGKGALHRLDWAIRGAPYIDNCDDSQQA